MHIGAGCFVPSGDSRMARHTIHLSGLERVHEMPPTYKLAPVDFIRLNESHAVALSQMSGEVRTLDSSALRVLQLCREERTLDGHVEAARARVPAIAATLLRPMLEDAVAAGVLRRVDAEAERYQHHLANRQVQDLGVLAIVTADRPDRFRRCLESYLAHARAQEHVLAIVVADGSKADANSRAVSEIATSAATTGGVRISVVDTDRVRGFRDSAKAAGFPNDVVDWLLPMPGTGYEAGAVRNRVVLETAGARVLTVDDDTVCDVWRPPGAEPGIGFVGHDDPRESAFFHDRASAIAIHREHSCDLYGEHARVLGEPIAQLHPARWDATHAGSHLMRALGDSRHASIVRATWSGLAGDAANYCPYSMLFARGSLRRTLAADERTFDLALNSREVRRATRRVSVADEDWLMTYCAGLDNTTMLPPFNPVGYNEDGLFGTTLKACDPGAFVGHIPLGIVHDSHRQSRYDGTRIASACTVRLTDVFSVITRQWATVAPDRHPSDRMRSLGGHCRAFGALELADFTHELIRLVVMLKGRALRRCEALLRGDEFCYPPYWRREVERYEMALLESLKRPDFWWPEEYRHANSTEDVARQTRAHIHFWGRSLSIWPDLWQFARRTSLDTP
jgi:hypothetical protein